MEAATGHRRHVLLTLQGAVQKAEGEAQKAWALRVTQDREDADLVFDVRAKLLEASNMIEERLWPGRRFPLGRVVMTQGARALIANPQEAEDLIERHAGGNWGDLDSHDKAVNEVAVDAGDRILSKYDVDGAPVYVITEGDRSTTTIMRPDEY